MASRTAYGLLVAAVVGVGVGCAIASPANGLDNPSVGNGGGAPVVSGVPPSATTGTGAGTPLDAGGDAANLPLTSYEYLCGGSQAACLPGLTRDLCAPGGNPYLGGGGSAPSSSFSCQLVTSDAGDVTAQCATAGAGGDGDPCHRASDCAAELGCIEAEVTPVCRAYCCDGLDSCPSNTYCVASPMAGAPTHSIPVCIPAMPCVLLEDSETCPANTACAIVRESGTTSCVEPGSGRWTPAEPSQACPCAAGFTCSWTEGTCVQLCHTGSTDCGPAGSNTYCQGGLAPYPDGIGYCITY